MPEGGELTIKAQPKDKKRILNTMEDTVQGYQKKSSPKSLLLYSPLNLKVKVLG